MDNSFVPLGDSILTESAKNNLLGFLFDGNQATFSIESDATPRLIHLKLTRVFGASHWNCLLENDTLENLSKIYEFGQAGYDPPRIVDELGRIIANDPSGTYTAPHFGSFNLVELLGPEIPLRWQSPGAYDNNTVLVQGPLILRTHYLQEVGTYIIPIAYHRTTNAGFECIQVLRSDASFWPMPMHTANSIQHSLNNVQETGNQAFNNWGEQYPIQP